MHGLKSSQVLFCFGFLGMQVSSFPSTTVEESVFPPCIFLTSLSQTNCPHKCRFISRLSIMFHSSMHLFLCHSHTVLMTITLYYSLKSGHAIIPVLFFFLKIVLAIQSPLCSHIDFRIICSCSIKKNVVSILIEIALSLQIALSSMVILTILILPIQEHSISFHLFVLSLISLTSILQFSKYKSFTSFSLFLVILFF